MNRFKIRLLARATQLAVVGCLVGALSGCGTGQVAQTAMQDPAVNGNKITINNVLLRDIRIQAPQATDFIQPGTGVDLVLVAVNQSPDQPDRLVNISSDIGAVAISGDARLPAGGMLFVGTPDGQNVAPGPPQSSAAARATVMLDKPITNGLTYKFTFSFEKAGQDSVAVPISAGLAPQQEPAHHA